MDPVREATKDDIAELVRLRAILFDDLGTSSWGPPPQAGASWRDACAAMLAELLASDTARILVVDGPDGLAACGICIVDQRLPSPYNPRGMAGHLLGIVTDPAYRGRGYAKAITAELLSWCDDRGLGRVDLHASPDAHGMYRRFGFADHPDPAMSRKRTGRH